MITIGIKNIIIHQGYMSSCECTECKKTEENEITIFCDAFVLGSVFWPLKWFAWNRQANITCQNCNKRSSISELNGLIKEKALSIFSEHKIPFRYYILSALVILYFIVSVFNL